MQMPCGYQIPENMDAAYLRTCLGIPTPLSGELPEFSLAIRRSYFHMAHALRRLGALNHRGMDATQIATVVALATMQENERDETRQVFREAINDGLVSEGQKVVMWYRGVEHVGNFLRMEGDKIIVLHDGRERKCSPASVRLCREGEFPALVP